jgi:small subunit ribosomal protein S2
MHEHIAVEEAKKLNIPTFAIVDTNSDPSIVDFPIPANDDATKSIKLIVDYVTEAVHEGLVERQQDKEKAAAEAPEEVVEVEAEGSTEEAEKPKRKRRARKAPEANENN